MEKYPTDPSEVHEGQQVRIDTDDEEFEGAVVKVITKQHNFLGIKVKIDSGKVGRIKSFVSEATSEENYLEKKFRQDRNLEEGQMLEYKASFLFDLDRHERDGTTAIHRNNPHSIAKTIAAFANSKGGTLYVGIRNKDKKILGLESDYSILKAHEDEGKPVEIKDDSGEAFIKFKSNGEFQASLKKAMEQLFHSKYDYIDYTTVDIFNASGKDLCVIKVKSSKRPVILCNKKKYEFYVRHADQSEQYEDIARFCEYWCEHMCELSA